jgi:hypothetical protein
MKIKSFGWLLALTFVATAVPATYAQPRGTASRVIVADGPGQPPTLPGGGGILTDGPGQPPTLPGGGGIVADGPTQPPRIPGIAA